MKRALEEGNQAFNSKNYDIAIVKFEEGYKASPDFVGSAPVLLNNSSGRAPTCSDPQLCSPPPTNGRIRRISRGGRAGV